MAQQWSTGAAHIYVGLPGVGSPRYFGTAKNGPDQDVRPEYVPAMNDLAGPTLPLDEMYVGQDVVIGATMTRWDESIHAALAAIIAGNDRGTDGNLDRGTLMIHEGFTFPLWVTYPFSALGAYDGLPEGYHFFACKLISPYRLPPGIRPYEVTFTFHALGVYQKNGGGFKVYDHNVAGLPPPS